MSRANVLPLVSVILTTYNRRILLPYAIKSVLEQTYQNYEIIVVNDFGEDVWDIIQSFNSEKIKYLCNIKNSGPSFSRNIAIETAKGSVICYLDDDDLYLPNHLDEIITVFNNNDDIDVLYTDAIYINEKLNNSERQEVSDETMFVGNKYSYSRLLIANYIPINSLSHRKKVFEDIGLFDESIKSHEDWDFQLRLGKVYSFYNLDKVTVEVRNRINQKDNILSKNNENFYYQYIDIYRKYPASNLCVFKKRQQVITYYRKMDIKDLNINKIISYLREKFKLRKLQIQFLVKYKKWDKEC